MPITADFHIQLLSAIHKVQGECIDGSHAVELFDGLLNELLDLTSSEYGFIGEALHNGTQPYLKTYAITDISWNEETRSFYESNAPQGLEFLNLDTLFGAVIKSHRPVISNSPVTDPRAGGVPPGHPHSGTISTTGK